MGFDYCASSIHNCKAYIIAKGVIDGVGGFGVDYKELGFGVHGHLPLSFDELIIAYGFAFVNSFEKNFLAPGHLARKAPKFILPKLSNLP
jgi:hypothetical protein